MTDIQYDIHPTGTQCTGRLAGLILLLPVRLYLLARLRDNHGPR